MTLDLPQPSSAPIGGRYELHARLGSGGMGSVYRAWDREVEEFVALKLLRVDAGPSGELLERFRREVRLARRITHRNAARVYDLGHDGPRWYLTMELIEGESLADLLARPGPLAPAQACSIAADICTGLAAIHRAGVVHRDLKPANVLLARDELGGLARAVVTDFGIAKAVDPERTLTRGIIGTPGYMAPEQALGDSSVDARADVYALGVIIYRMLCGHHPCEASTDGKIERLPAWPPPLAASVPAQLAALVHACLARRAQQRPADADALAEALREFAETGSLASDRVRVASPAAADDRVTSRQTTSKRVLAILPLQARGASDCELATTISEEIIDQLSHSHELWVTSFAASQGFAERRDPKLIGRELGADYVVDGALRQRGGALRITLRMIDASTGLQVWSDHCEGELVELLELEDDLVRKLAEQLRVELLIQSPELAPDSEALSRFLCAREHMRQGSAALVEAYTQLDAALAIEPEFAAAATARALVALRCWFLRSDEGPMWRRRAEAALIHAERVAPEHSASYEAKGIHALHTGDLAAAVFAFKAALAIAPTTPTPLYYLGLLACESGQFERGRARLELVHRLAPTWDLPVAELARCAALLGDHEQHARWMSRLERSPGAALAHAMISLRAAAWRRDNSAVERWRQVAEFVGRESGQSLAIPGLYASAASFDTSHAAALAEAEQLGNGRLRTLILQCLVEVACFHGRVAIALALLERCVDARLFDLGWLERCPLLAPLRAEPSYAELHGRLYRQTLGLWSRTTGELLG